MNVLGHIGVPLGAALALDIAVNLARRRNAGSIGKNATVGLAGSARQRRSFGLGRSRYLTLAIGALLPDLIDKVLAFGLAPELVNHSLRSIGHTLLFNAILLSVATFVFVLHQRWPLLLAVGSMSHILLDKMWESPITFLWPFHGFRFPSSETTFSAWRTFHFGQLLDSPESLSGIIVLFLLAQWLYLRPIAHKVWKKRQLTSSASKGNSSLPRSQGGPASSSSA